MRGNRKLSRRELLRGTAFLAAGAALAACGVTTTGSTPTSAPAATQAPAEATAAPAAAATQAPAAEATATPAAVAATTAPTAAAATGAEVSIRWQDWPDWEPQMTQLMDMLAKKLPGIKVEFEPLSEGFEDKTLAAMVAGTAPDVITGWGPVFRKWAEKGQLLDLQPFVDKDMSADTLADFNKWQWDGMVTKDTHIRFAVPYYINLIMLYYNKSIFDEAGLPYPDKTWDHDIYAENLKKLTKKDGDKFVRWGGAGDYAIQYDRALIGIQQYGGHYVNPDDWTECWIGKQEALNALEWTRARMWDDNSLAQPLQVQSIGKATGSSTGPWAANMLATWENGMGAIMGIIKESKFPWAITHLPKGPARRATLGTTDGWAVYKGTKHPDACWKLLMVLTSPDFQQFIMEAWAGIPCRKSLLPKWKDTLIKANPVLENANLDAILETLDEGYPMLTEEFKVQGESQTAIEAALQKVFQEGQTKVDYFKQVADEVTKINRGG